MSPKTEAQRIPGSPDIVVLALTTQWRASAFGFAGDPNARTPRLDELARESRNFAEAVTPHPFGVFARAALLTGAHCPGNGIRDYYDPLPADTRTIAHAYAELGWDTAFFGKWQLYERDPEQPVVGEAHARIMVPPDRRGGFAFWEGFESGFLLNDPLLHGTELPRPRRFDGYQSDVLVDRFLTFATQRRSKRPLFAYISFDAPHPPYGAPAPGTQRPEPASLRLLDSTSRLPAVRDRARRELSGYYAHIEATDRAIGRLWSYLQEGVSRGKVLLAFASVHGDMHGVDGKFRKGWPHEESVRTPLLLWWRGVLEGGRVDRRLISLVDLGPTLLGLSAGAEAPRLGPDGQDWSKALGGTSPLRLQQDLSMPSVPPFADQCPYAWTAARDAQKTVVQPEAGQPYTLWHREATRFEPSGEPA